MLMWFSPALLVSSLLWGAQVADAHRRLIPKPRFDKDSGYQDELNFDSPAATPIQPIQPTKETIPQSALLQVDEVVPKGTLHSSSWRIHGQPVGRGANGRVYRVTMDNSSDSTEYALKHCDFKSDCENEAKVFAKMPARPGILNLVDAAPRFSQESDRSRISKGAAYVMPLANNGSFLDWCSSTGKSVKDTCKEDIGGQLISGLSTIHEYAKVVHQDVKASNVVVSRPKLGQSCPGVYIIDFGLAEAVNDTTTFFRASQEPDSWHLVSDIFGVNSSKLTSEMHIRVDNDKRYIVDPKIDWCSYAAMMIECFSDSRDDDIPDIPVPPSVHVDCGMMGRSRRTHVKLP